jgi:hypothetical protein
MRNLWIGIVVVGLAVGMQSPAAAQKKEIAKTKKQLTTQVAQEVYSCPMHAEITAAKVGTCSKCGMALEKKVEKNTTGEQGKQGHKAGTHKEGNGKCGGCTEPCGDH